VQTVLAGTGMSTIAMTYEDLAQRLRISVPSARRLVLRRRWGKGRGNDGKSVVQVPEEFLQRREDSRTDGLPDDVLTAAMTDPATVAEPAGMADLMTRLAAAQDQLVEMARRQGASEAEANALKAQVEEVRTDRDAWRRQAEEAMRQLTEQRRPGLLARLLGRGA
jgi:hypothetical protein